MVKKEKENPNYHMGKNTGYELIDGVYHIAPTYQERFKIILNKKIGIDDMLKSVTGFASETLANISKEQIALWNDICDDIGLDKSIKWIYKPGGTIIKSDDNPEK